MKKVYKTLLIVLAICIVAGGAGYAAFEHYFKSMNAAGITAEDLNGVISDSLPDEAKLFSAPSPSPSNSPLPDDSNSAFSIQNSPLPSDSPFSILNSEFTNILLVGRDSYNLDSLESRRGNADGLVIVTINNETKQIVLTSILRDTFLYTEQSHGTKATLIYHYYGLDALINAIQDNLDIKIDNYVLFNYLDVMEIIDAVGGVDVELYPEEIRVMNSKMNQLNAQLLNLPKGDGNLDPEKPGTYTLTGKQAAVYMRVRLSDATNNDFGRTARERSIILKLKDKIAQMNAGELMSFASTFAPKITTDFTESEIISLALSAPEYKGYQFVTGYIPQPDTYWGADGFLYIDFDENREYLQKLIGND